MTDTRYIIDPDDPRAPTQELWDRMNEEERRWVVANLPSEIERAFPPEGDQHRVPKQRAFEALNEHFRSKGRSVYLSSELPVYYPGEAMFAPDLIAVLDVEPYERNRWVVSAEARGLDFVLEVVVSGERRKDLERNVVRYSRLGIPEYFVFEPRRKRLVGYRLIDDGSYQPIVPQNGHWSSVVLGLELVLDDGRLRFFAGATPLPDARELIDRLSSMVDDAVARVELEAQRAKAEAERADAATKRADAATKRADAEAGRADAATKRADAEAGRADAEAGRADAEAGRAERYAAKLRELGVDPSALA